MDTEEILKRSDEFLAKAFNELFPDWGTNMLKEEKAYEVRAIIKGGCKPCASFVNWVKFIDFLRNDLSKSNSSYKDFRKNVLLWWNNLSSLTKTQICDTNTGLLGICRRWETLTGIEIEILYKKSLSKESLFETPCKNKQCVYNVSDECKCRSIGMICNSHK
jgi:hypothetical protein